MITGATGKFGRIFTKHFLANGYIVYAIGRSDIKLQDLRDSNYKYSDSLVTVSLDLSADIDFTHLYALFDTHSWPYYLINNARNLDYLACDVDGKVTRNNFLAEMSLDVVVPYELSFALANNPNSNLISIVNIGSQYGSVASNLSLYDYDLSKCPLNYGVSKAALSHLTKELAVRLAHLNVRVNCLAFGGVSGRASPEFVKRYSALCPMRRMLDDSELIGPIKFMLFSESSAITGQTLNVDCGWALW